MTDQDDEIATTSVRRRGICWVGVVFASCLPGVWWRARVVIDRFQKVFEGGIQVASCHVVQTQPFISLPLYTAFHLQTIS